MADSCFCVWRVTFGNRASNDYFLAKRTCPIEVASLSEATSAYRLWAKFLQIKQLTKNFDRLLFYLRTLMEVLSIGHLNRILELQFCFVTQPSHQPDHLRPAQ